MTSNVMRWQQVIDAGTPSNSNDQVLVSPSERSVAYGDGFFTTMGVRSATVMWQTEHAHRLVSHLQALYLYLSAEAISHLWATVAQAACQIGEGILKLIITRQTQTLRGYAFSSRQQDKACHVWLGVLATPLTAHLSHNKEQDLTRIPIQPAITAICLEARLACLPESLVGLKTLNRLDNVMAAGELTRYKQTKPNQSDKGKKNEFDTIAKSAIGEGLVRDITGQWVEGVMSNVFYQLADTACNNEQGQEQKQWHTPPIEQSGVKGVMRQVIMERLANWGENSKIKNNAIKNNCIERRLHDDDLGNMKALFFCNAVRGIIPVQALLLPNQTWHTDLHISVPEFIIYTSA